MEWCKLHNDIIHDPKIRALAFEDRWHFVALMVLMNDGTLHEPEGIRDELVEVCLGLHGVDLASLKKRLIRLRLINANWQPLRWDARQTAKDATGAERQRKYREKQRLRKGDALRDGDITAPLRTEEEVEEEYITRNLRFNEFWQSYPKKVDKKKANKKFNSLSETKQKAAIVNVQARAKADKQWLDGYAPYPTTYLNGERWDDEWSPAQGSQALDVDYE